MKLKECKDCYYEGREKCFFYDKPYKELKIKECKEGFLDPYMVKEQPGEYMRVLVACEESQPPEMRSKTFSGIAKAMANQWG